MSDLRIAAQQALEALEAGLDVNPILAGEAEEALRAALAQQDEPRNQCGEGGASTKTRTNATGRGTVLRRRRPSRCRSRWRGWFTRLMASLFT